jgi:DNA-binding NarL/FixJ family response regulator
LLASHDDIEVVAETGDGREAIEKVQEASPDVVLMDIAMPVMDGLEATRRIRKSNLETKIIVLTQHDNKEYVVSCVKAGAVGYVPKRAVAAELVSAIRCVYRGDSYLYPSLASAVLKDYLRRVDEEPFDGLSNREREVLKLIAEGHTSQEIADILCASVKTIMGHRTRIMEKLDIHNRTELIKYAIRKGLISTDS